MNSKQLKKEFDDWVKDRALPSTGDLKGYTKEALAWAYIAGYELAQNERNALNAFFKPIFPCTKEN